MNDHLDRRTGALLASAVLTSSLLLVPAAAFAAPQPAEVETASSCIVTDGALTWGVKESFRSYISGSIANGSWEATEGATYDTPSFKWGGATGNIDPATGAGSVSFVGTVHFTGHDGVLDLTLANPTLEFEGDGKAALLIDARSTDASGEVTIDSSQEWVADVEAPMPLENTNTDLTVADMPAVLTNSGAKAFAGFYEAGAELDPVGIALTFENCEASGITATPADEDPVDETAVDPAPVAEAEQQVPWIPIVIGGVAILVIGVTAGMLLSGRKRKGDSGSQPAQPDAADPQA